MNWTFWEKRLLNNFWIEYSWKITLNNPLNWILSWNEWITQFLNRYLPFLMISPLFCLFWTLFGQFLGTFPIRPVLIIPWLLNWIIFWIESPEFILNWIIFWIESWVKKYWIEYWMNHFLAKFKYWIESDWVSLTTMSMIVTNVLQRKRLLGIVNSHLIELKSQLPETWTLKSKIDNLHGVSFQKKSLCYMT